MTSDPIFAEYDVNVVWAGGGRAGGDPIGISQTQ